MRLSLKHPDSVPSVGTDIYHRFVALLEELSKYIEAAEGIKTVARAHTGDAQRSLASLPDNRKQALFHSFLRFYNLCVELSLEGLSLRDNHKMILKHLEREGLFPDLEVCELLSKHDFVETYNVDFIQTFRTLNFFDYTAHTLEDLFLRPYWELYRRSEEVEMQIVKKAAMILSGESKGPIYDFVGMTTVREINSSRNILSRINTIVAGPLYSAQTGEICGIIHIVDVLNQSEIKLFREDH